MFISQELFIIKINVFPSKIKQVLAEDCCCTILFI